MDNPDIRVDPADDGMSSARTYTHDLAGRGERPPTRDGDAPSGTWPAMSPTSHRSAVGNPRRVRL